MADKYRKSLTDDQRKTLKPTFDKIEQLVDELSTKLTEMGQPPSEEPGDSGCFFCGCPSFVPGGGGTGIRRRCARPGCGHSLIAHMT
jgi:hypothetical protein